MLHTREGIVLVIAIGSTNPAKINAVRGAIAPLWPDAALWGVSVDSGVSIMPRNDEEGVRGARQRAQLALASRAEATLGVGLEGSVQELPWGMFLTTWVAVVDRAGREGLASGGRLPLPACIAAEVRQGAELGPVMDRYSGQENSKQHQGAAGFLTAGRVARDEAIQIAVCYALAPFLHPQLYASAGSVTDSVVKGVSRGDPACSIS
jgi:inosine/xanthosine triphosphatase